MIRLATLAILGAIVGNPAVDPRLAPVERMSAGDDRGALAEVDRLRAADPARAGALGLPLLRAHLLERLGREKEATAAFAAAIGESPDLAPWARLRLAALQARLGHPEVTAGVAATLLAHAPPAAIVPEAVELLVAALRRGGDCRLLRGLAGRTFARPPARRLELLRAECDVAAGDHDAALRRLRALLREERGDLAAFDAAELWRARLPLPADRQELAALGEALAGQRDFARAVPVLEAALAGEARSGSPVEAETIYRLARAEFWLGRFARAGAVFEELFRSSRPDALRADARYQQGRCRELAGDPRGARALFHESWALDPRGEWAGPALLSVLRLDWRENRRLDATAALERLRAERRHESALARAALFLAASEIVTAEPPAGAGAGLPPIAKWLDFAAASELASEEEIAYWRGRLAEREGRLDVAVSSYVDAQRSRPFHPLALASRARLAQPALAAPAGAFGAAALRGSAPGANRAAWILLGPELPVALAARARALPAWGAAPATAIWIHWTPTPAAGWPLYRAPPGRTDRAEDKLLALGLFREGAPALSRHFPLAKRELAFTASRFQEVQGQSGAAIELAERLFDGRPKDLPDDWVEPGLRRLLYPLPYRSILLTQASLRRIDPWLLAAILREESRFRPEAVSPVGARGIAQLTVLTARRLAAGMGLRAPSVSDLHRPEVAIPLAAAYVAELAARFDGSVPAIVAAYNAGEAQTELWRSYCSTREPEELLAKIGFRETRAYVFRVLESRAQYAALYGL